MNVFLLHKDQIIFVSYVCMLQDDIYTFFKQKLIQHYSEFL